MGEYAVDDEMTLGTCVRGCMCLNRDSDAFVWGYVKKIGFVLFCLYYSRVINADPDPDEQIRPILNEIF